MCKYCDIGITCNDQVIETGLTNLWKTELLNKHNELRAKVANGQEHGQPSAQNMNKLEWDDELARNAQLWADQCPDKSWNGGTSHDANRLTIVHDGPIGQNVGDLYSKRDKRDTNDWKYFLRRRVSRWYNKGKDWSAANVGSWSKVGATGQYTQVIWAETKKVGCGVIYYKWWAYYRKVTT